MKPIAVTLALGAFIAGVVAVALSRPGNRAPGPEGRETAAWVEELSRNVAELGRRQEELARSVEQLGSRIDSLARPAVATGEGGAVPVKAVAAEEERREEAAPEEESGLDSLIAELQDPRAPRAEKERAWRSIRERGLLDRAVQAMEEKASDHPRDPGLQTLAGQAYIQKLISGASDREVGTLALKADQAFDAALAADPNHWEARFSKAISLSFWPPIFGKQSEAVKQLEILAAQQEQAPATRPEFAETYLYLGNLHAQQGSPQKAAEAWKKGVALFPDHAELSRRAAEGQ